jgi:hypothetical protein
LYQGSVGGDFGGDLAGTERVEDGDVLTEDCLQVPFTDALGDMFAGVNEADGLDVGQDEGTNR